MKGKRKGGIGKLVIVAIVGAVAAIALSEGLRNKVLDALFGAEEEFDYSSNTTPPPPPPNAASYGSHRCCPSRAPSGRPSSFMGRRCCGSY